MHQRVIYFLLATLLSMPAFALQDKAMISQIQEIREFLRVEPALEKRIARLEKFKETLDEHVRQTPVVKTPAGRAEFAEMNEIFMAILSINVSVADKSGCARSAEKIRSEGRLSEDSVKIAKSANIALSILNLVCR